VANNNNNRFHDCHFINNTANIGGAMYTQESSSSTITTSTFIDNQARTNGGALATVESSRANLYNVTFQRNVAQSSGGAIVGMFPINVSCRLSLSLSCGILGVDVRRHMR